VATGKQITYDLNKVDGSVTMRSIKGTHLDNFKKLSDAELASIGLERLGEKYYQLPSFPPPTV